MADKEEVVHLLERIETLTEELVIRGLRTAGPEHFSTLEMLRDELLRVNAEHLAERVDSLVIALRNDDRGAAASLLRLRASLQLFERMLTKQVVTSILEGMQAGDGSEGRP